MPHKNLLLDRLPREVYDRISPDLEKVVMTQGQILHRKGEQIKELYFPLTCMISITIMMKDGRTVETGAIGSREVVGINAFMGGRETTDTEYIVQLPGDAMVIAAAPLKIEFNRNTEMRKLMLKYTQALMAQISQNVGCNRLHEDGRRFARWLLEVRDRVEADEFPLTQKFMGEMLGVRREGVTNAARKLKREGVIDYSRGHIQILDLARLQAASCECYKVLKDEYDRLLGTKARRRSSRRVTQKVRRSLRTERK